MQSEKYTLVDVINLAILAGKIDQHTAIPGEVISYDPVKQTVQVKISIDRQIAGEQIAYPILDGISVIFPRSGSHGISFPLEKGDGVILLFSERSLESWRTRGGGYPPYDSRKFDLNDAVAIPGMFPTAGVMVPPPVNATEIRGKKVFIGDPKQVMTPITIVGTPLPGVLPATGDTEVLVQPLDLVAVVETLISLVSGAAYSGAPSSGGGGIDVATALALGTLLTDIGKLKV